MKKFLKNSDLLRETKRDSDFFDFSKNTKNLYDILVSSKKPTVTTIIAPYGSGKSVLLNEVEKIAKAQSKEDIKWITFECWQYPDKRDLWEGLILEAVGKIEGNTKKDKLLSPYSDLPTWRNDLATFLSGTIPAISTVIGIFAVSFFVLSIDNEWLSDALIALITAMVVLLLSTINFLVQPQSKSAISRLADYKQELTDALKDYTGTIYIVLEDVDRAGELGTRFFETVSHFIKDGELKDKNIKIIVPIADDDSNKDLREAIEKVSDNTLIFKPSYNADDFITNVFTESFLSDSTKELLSAMVNPLINGSISIRKMKHIFRNAIIKHTRLDSTGFKSKLEICIAVEFSKYMKVSIGTSSVFQNAGNHFEHKPLYRWAEQNGLLNKAPDNSETEVEPVDYLKSSHDVFPDIRYQDHATNMSRSKPIVRREYLISRAYFEDI